MHARPQEHELDLLVLPSTVLKNTDAIQVCHILDLAKPATVRLLATPKVWNGTVVRVTLETSDFINAVLDVAGVHAAAVVGAWISYGRRIAAQRFPTNAVGFQFLGGLSCSTLRSTQQFTHGFGFRYRDVLKESRCLVSRQTEVIIAVLLGASERAMMPSELAELAAGIRLSVRPSGTGLEVVPVHLVEHIWSPIEDDNDDIKQNLPASCIVPLLATGATLGLFPWPSVSRLIEVLESAGSCPELMATGMACAVFLFCYLRFRECHALVSPLLAALR